MTRLRAFVVHLSASLAVVLAFLPVIVLAWFPAPYFELYDGWAGLGTLAAVAVALGPLLTLAVFKPGKPGLAFDLSVILGLQLAALTYAGILVYQQRPAFTVFAVDRFTAISAAEVDFARLRYPELKFGPGSGPLLAQALPPEDPRERRALMFEVILNGAKDWEYRAELYHLRSDPGERQNLIDDPQRTATVIRLKSELQRLQEQTGALPDRMPIDEGIQSQLPDEKIR